MPKPFTDRARRCFSVIGIALTAMMLFYIGAQYLAMIIMRRYLADYLSPQWMVWILSFVPLYLIGVPTFALIVRRIPVEFPPERKKMSVGAWFVTLIMCFGVMYIGSYVGNMVMALVNEATGNDAQNTLSELLRQSSPLINLAVTVLVAPIVEEMIFRRAIINRTLPYGERTSIIFSALMFGLFHGNLYQFFYAFGLGMLLAFIYVRTGRVWYTIPLHMAINLVGGVIAPFLLGKVDLDKINSLAERMSAAAGNVTSSVLESMTPSELGWIMLLGLYSLFYSGVSIVGVVLLIVKRKKFYLKPTGEREIPRSHIGSIVYYNVGVFAAIVGGLVLMVLSLR